jgi:hypothetical protein
MYMHTYSLYILHVNISMNIGTHEHIPFKYVQVQMFING